LSLPASAVGPCDAVGAGASGACCEAPGAGAAFSEGGGAGAEGLSWAKPLAEPAKRSAITETRIDN
jgi:hypothetical protein